MLNENEIDKVVVQIMKRDNIYKKLSVQKYYTLDRFLSSLETNMFTFQKPSTWEDPFEDFMSKLVNTHKHALYNRFQITDNIYAMSTINKNNECDGMWNNFAKKTGVLIHIRIKTLLNSIIKYLLDNNCCNNTNTYRNNIDIERQLLNSIRIKKIEYLTDENIARRFREETKKHHNDFDELSYEMLSIKRIEFDYENEYRFFINQELLGLEEVQYLNIGYLKNSIEKIIISPRVDIEEKNRLKNIFSKKYSISPDIIEQSNLYNIDHFKKTYDL